MPGVFVDNCLKIMRQEKQLKFDLIFQGKFAAIFKPTRIELEKISMKQI